MVRVPRASIYVVFLVIGCGRGGGADATDLGANADLADGGRTDSDAETDWIPWMDLAESGADTEHIGAIDHVDRDGDADSIGATELADGNAELDLQGETDSADGCAADVDGACTNADLDGEPSIDARIDACDAAVPELGDNGEGVDAGEDEEVVDVLVCIPEKEKCNGVDDDCDGLIDVVPSGDSLCDDGDDCTADFCLAGGMCAHFPDSGIACDDGNSCTVSDVCLVGVCGGSTIVCDDGDICTDDACALGKCQVVPNQADCDDKDPCTVADECANGACSGWPVGCECGADTDCATLDDGDLCNGTLACDKSALPHKCSLKAGSIVVCPKPDKSQAQCSKAACAPLTGLCSVVPANEMGACDDFDPCTVGDNCKAGLCMGDGEANCTDANPCTEDFCTPFLGCEHLPNSEPCSDGNPCTTDDFCSGGKCVGGPGISCDDANLCTSDACDPAAGCTHAPVDAACDDGSFCTVGDTCMAGWCAGTTLVSCEDSNNCTDDSCDPGSGCVHVPAPGPCSDGSACTTDDECSAGACQGGLPLECEDGNVCTDASCDPVLGCKQTPNSQPCNDGNVCTLADICSQGTCLGKKWDSCDDWNPCTNDACTPDAGCSHADNQMQCSDFDECTTGDTCQDGVCLSSGVLDCDDGDICTLDSCDPTVGCVNSEEGGLCGGAAALSLGCSHMCAVSGSNVSCTGANNHGQLGDGAKMNSALLVSTAGLVQPLGVTLGCNFSCALESEGTVACWGENGAGQLGNGSYDSSATAGKVAALAGVQVVAAGKSHVCAVKHDGSLWCWGNNYSGQLGVGTNWNNQKQPVSVPGISDIGSMALGSDHTCATQSDGSVWCWGDNYYGQTGTGTGPDILVPQKLKGISGVKGMDSFGSHTCAATTSGKVFCWGRNSKSQLGDGVTANSATPVEVSGVAGVAEVAVGNEFSCALLYDGTIKCWGAGQEGQLGDGNGQDSTVPVGVSGIDDAVYVAAGGTTACALRASDTLWCWGSAASGQAGTGVTGSNSATPVPVNGLESVDLIDAGGYTTCARSKDEPVMCWGYGAQGQLGDGLGKSSGTPVTVTGVTDAAQIGVGGAHACAMAGDGVVRCWGSNLYGQVGDGSFINRFSPVVVAGLAEGASAVGCGSGHTCALLSSGDTWCWGSNSHGEVSGQGYGFPWTVRNSPFLVPGLAAGTGIGLGGGHSCIVSADAGAWCWGYNYYGQLGDGSTDKKYSPVQAAGLTDVVAVLGGYYFSCAMGKQETLSCWGYNYNGELGDGTTTAHAIPAPVVGVSGVVSSAAGDSHVCAASSDGAAYCWGDNEYGQVGSGTFSAAEPVPLMVGNLSGVVQVATGIFHSCALLSDGTVWCWGRNYEGSLGQGCVVLKSPEKTLNFP